MIESRSKEWKRERRRSKRRGLEKSSISTNYREREEGSRKETGLTREEINIRLKGTDNVRN